MGSFSSSSSGPRPNSSSSTSEVRVSRSNKLNGSVALSRSRIAGDDAANLRLGVRARDLGESIEVEPVEEILMNASLQRLIAGDRLSARLRPFEGSRPRHQQNSSSSSLRPPQGQPSEYAAALRGGLPLLDSAQIVWPSPETRRRAGSGRAPPDGRRSARRRRRGSRWGCSA